MTTSQVSMETRPKPSSSAFSTSGAAPWLNQSVSRRRMSCRLLPRAASLPLDCASATLRKKAATAGATWRCAVATSARL